MRAGYVAAFVVVAFVVVAFVVVALNHVELLGGGGRGSGAGVREERDEIGDVTQDAAGVRGQRDEVVAGAGEPREHGARSTAIAVAPVACS